MNEGKPKITVLMPVYNGEKYLTEAIESILNQTNSDFEFIIIDDNSTDGTAGILKRYLQKDNRIRLFNMLNQGLATSLNYGLELAQGKYIARMDSDDISMPERLEKQAMFMDKNPYIGVCGTWIKIFGERNYIKKYPQTHEEIWSRLLFECPLAHPTVMIRKDMLIKNNLYYDINCKHNEDYELWTRVSNISRMANIPEGLLKYRLHNKQLTNTYPDDQVRDKFKISVKHLSQLYKITSDNESSIHRLFFPRQNTLSIALLIKGHEWLCKLINENDRKHVFPEPEFSRLLAERWLFLCIKARYIGFRVLILYWNSKLRRPVSQCLGEIMKLLINRPYKTYRKQEL